MAIEKSVAAFRKSLRGLYGPEGHSQKVGGPHSSEAAVRGLHPETWPERSILFIFNYGLKKLLSDCVRSGVSGKKAPHSKEGARKAMQKILDAKVLSITLGELQSGIPLEVAQAIALVKDQGLTIDAKIVRSWQGLEIWHAESYKGKVTFDAIKAAGMARAEKIRAARKAAAAIDPFA